MLKDESIDSRKNPATENVYEMKIRSMVKKKLGEHMASYDQLVGSKDYTLERTCIQL